MLYWFRFLQIMSGSMSFDNLSSLSLMRTSESFSDLNAELSGAASSSRAPARSSLASLRSTPATAAQTTTTSLTNPTAIGSASAAEECNNNINNKPFGLGETIKRHIYQRQNFTIWKGFISNKNLKIFLLLSTPPPFSDPFVTIAIWIRWLGGFIPSPSNSFWIECESERIAVTECHISIFFSSQERKKVIKRREQFKMQLCLERKGKGSKLKPYLSLFHIYQISSTIQEIKVDVQPEYLSPTNLKQ